MELNFIAQKIKQLRISHGWTLEELAAKLGGIVSKQAISKYEQGKSYPSTKVLVKIAHTFGVKIATLTSKPKYEIKFIAYRKKLSLSKKNQNRIENFVKERFEERLSIQELLEMGSDIKIPVQKYSINSLEEAEECANSIRKLWKIGVNEISSVTDVLENNFVHVIKIDAHENFDGLSAIAYSGNRVKGVGVVVKNGLDGERQRLSLAHELGHVVLNVNGIDEEKAAFRFGAAFLAPKELIFKEVGTKRTKLDVREMMILKKKIGMSVQALIYRLKDLEVISEDYCRHCFKVLSGWGWRKKEPKSLQEESPEWLSQNVYKALAEGLIAKKDAEILLNESINDELSLSLQRKRSFMKLPLAERKRILSEQAEMFSEEYKGSKMRDVWQGGDIIGQ